MDYHELDMLCGELQLEVKVLQARVQELERQNRILQEQTRNLERQVYRGPTM